MNICNSKDVYMQKFGKKLSMKISNVVSKLGKEDFSWK